MPKHHHMNVDRAYVVDFVRNHLATERTEYNVWYT